MDDNQVLDFAMDIRTETGKTQKTSKWYMVFRKKRTLLLIFIPLSFFILWLAQNNPTLTEYAFSRGIYKWISRAVSFVSGIFPFSLMELEVIVIPVSGIILLFRFFVKVLGKFFHKSGDTGYTFALGILNLVCTLGIVFFLYLVMGGLNYYRVSFTEYSGLEIKESSVEELYNLCVDLANQASDIRSELHDMESMEDENGVLQLKNGDWKTFSGNMQDAFLKLSEEYPVLSGYYPSLKPVFFSKFMSRMEITGIFWPFTMEANVNIDASDYSLPATMGHELAHLRGFMREDEANFIGYLVCKASDKPEYQYSGIMLALTYAANQLYRQDASLYQSLLKHYNTQMLADLRNEYYYWKQFEDTVISTVSNTVNDNYLKANKQSDGVKSYGKMVDLLLAEYRKNQEEEKEAYLE